MPANDQPSFSKRFNSQFRFGRAGTLTGRFGLNVIDDLIAGIDEFRAAAASNTSSRDLGPAMLGAFGWLGDQQLLNRIADFPHACVSFTKQPRPYKPETLARLQDALDRCNGFPTAALPGFETLAAPHECGQPQVVGPYTSLPRPNIKGLRTVGYRDTGDRIVPLLHAKMMLLGDLRWHDEDELGLSADILIFHPRRLWIGSANGTYGSRFSLEFGCWQTDLELLTQAQQFLTQLIAHSEDLDPDSDNMDPDLAEVEFDDEAMAEALAETEEVWDEDPE